VFADKNDQLEQGMQDLEIHQTQKEPCTRGSGDQALPGIRAELLAVLDRSRNKRKQKMTDIERWFEIWDVIFPNIERPPNPCKPTLTCVCCSEKRLIFPTLGVEEAWPTTARPVNNDHNSFLTILDRALDREFETGKIQFAEGEQEVMAQRLKDTIATHYRVHAFLNGTPRLTDTSSSDQTQQFAMPKTPENLHLFASGPSQSTSSTKVPASSGQAYIMMTPSNVPSLNLHQPNQFTSMASQMSQGLSFEQTNLSYIGNHLSAVPTPNLDQPVGLVHSDFTFDFNPDLSWDMLSVSPNLNEHDLDNGNGTL
jgi:hypothetical protein